MQKSLLVLSSSLIPLLGHAENGQSELRELDEIKREERAVAENHSLNRQRSKRLEELESHVENLKKEFKEKKNTFHSLQFSQKEPPLFSSHQQIIAGNSASSSTLQPSGKETGSRLELLEERVNDLQAQVKKLEEQKRDSSIPFNAAENGIFFTGEWLYWKFTEGGTEFAINRTLPPSSGLSKARSKKVTFDWKSGFRVGMGYQFAQKGWDLYACYTEVKPKGSDATSGAIYPLLNYQTENPVPNASEARAHWHINFKTLDVELGRRYLIAKSLFLRPFFGLKAALIYQHFRVKYGNTNPDFSGIPLGEFFTVKDQNDFRGIGLRAGVDSLWKMGGGFSFFGKLSGALLISQIKLHQVQDQLTPDLEAVEEIDLKSKFHPLVPMAQLAFGLEWERGFRKDKFRLHFDVGFESQYWWNQNQLERFDSDLFPGFVRISDDLGIYGLTLGGRFDF